MCELEGACTGTGKENVRCSEVEEKNCIMEKGYREGGDRWEAIILKVSKLTNATSLIYGIYYYIGK